MRVTSLNSLLNFNADTRYVVDYGWGVNLNCRRIGGGTTLDDLLELLKNLTQRFVWIRGSVTAVAVLALLSNLLDLTQYELLSAFNAVILSWKIVANQISSLLPSIWPFTLISPLLVQATIFSASISSTLLYATSNIDYDRIENISRYSPLYIFQYITIKTGIVDFFMKRPNTYRVIKFSLPLLFFVLFLMLYILVYISDFNDIYKLLPLLICIALLFYIATVISRSFRNGVYTVIAFIFTLEALYVLQAPFVSEAIRNYNCEYYGIESASCDAEHTSFHLPQISQYSTSAG